MMHKSRHWFVWALAVGIALPHLYVALAGEANLARWYRIDDAFFYFQIARNVAEGYGSTFDRFGLTNGYHPLWMLVCLPVFALARFDPYLPLRLLVLVMAALNFGGTLLLYRMLARLLSHPVAALAAVFWAFYPPIHRLTSQNGLETGLNAFFLILLVYLFSRLEPDRPPRPGEVVRLGLAAALLIFSRLDNVFVVGLLGLWLVLRDEDLRQRALLYLGASALSVPLAYALRLGLPDYYEFKPALAATLAAALAVRMPLFYFLGLYEHPAGPFRRRAVRLALAAGLSSALILAFMLPLGRLGLTGSFPRSVLLFEWGLFLLAGLAVEGLLGWLGGGAGTPAAGRPASLKTWLGRGLAFFGLPGASLLAYMTWNRLVFGTPMPVSGQIKGWWGGLQTVYGVRAATPGSLLGLEVLSGIVSSLVPGLPAALALVLPAAGLILLLVLLKRQKALRLAADRLSLLPLGLGLAVHMASYTARGYVGLRSWYWAPQMLLLTLLAALLVEGLLRLARASHLQTSAAQGLAWVLSLAVLLGFGGMLFRLVPLSPVQGGPDQFGLSAGFIQAHTEPGAAVGLTGGGDTAYFITGRTIVNLDGLVNSYEYFRLLRQFAAYRYLDAIGLDYVYAKPDMIFESDPYTGVFHGRLELVAVDGEYGLYRYISLGGTP
jgi:hypothetical protein